jgi:type IV fimbrial biogenesis protein FimT
MTLIEQVTVVAIVAVLACAASPSLTGLMRRGRMQSAQMDFLQALGYARNEAVTRQVRVLLCPTFDQVRCSEESRWDSGWLVGVDRDGDDQPDGPPLRVGAGHGRLRIRSSDARQHVTYLPDGSAPGSNLTLVFCHRDRAEGALTLVVSNSGRVRGSRPGGEQVAGCLAGE